MIKNGDYFEYQGCIHIHTSYSDGTKSVEEVAEIAASVDLDFILVSDHMTLEARREGKEGFYGPTFVAIGYEHNDREDCNHYLLFESEDVLPADMTPQEYVAEGARQGALGIIAHPDETRPRSGKYPSYPWLAWDAKGFDGIEIWNQMSEWMEKLTTFNRLKMLFSPRKFMTSPTDRILNIWDDLNRERSVVGLAAIDVHAYPYKFGPFRITIFPYKVQFQSLRTHLLLPEELARDTAGAKRQIYDAIRDCRLFVSNMRWGNGAGFTFQARQGSQTAIGGGRLESCRDTVIRVRAPAPGSIRLIENGRRVIETGGDSLEYRPEQNGLYRAEVYKNGRGWIYSNHIRIGV